MPKGNAFLPILHQFASIRFRRKPEKDDSKDDSGKIPKKIGNVNLSKKN